MGVWRLLPVGVVAAVGVAGAAVAVGGQPARPTATAPFAAVVRVDQVGYARDAAKHAFLMTSAPEGNATFALADARGRAVYTGHIGSSTGAWNSRFPYVYDLDFSGLTRTGTYRIAVNGPVPTGSTPFQVAAASRIYRQPLENARYFYENERDGADFVRTPLRTAPGHLNDAHATSYLTPKTDSDGVFTGDLHPIGKTVDVSGGWWDAGDYLKFVETTSYTVSVMLTGVRSFPAEMGRGAHGADLTAEAKFGLDWLQRMWDAKNQTLYYQVGIGSGNDTTVSDHDIWRLPQADDTYGGGDPSDRYIRHRPAFRAAPAGSLISPNLAGRLASDFALCYQVFKWSDPRYAGRCLRSAEQVFALADTHPKKLLTVIPYDFYPESSWQDDLELGAVNLYQALAGGPVPAGLPHSDPLYYLRAAAQWAHAYITGPEDAADSLNLYDVSGLAHYELYRAIGRAGNPGNLEVTRAALLGDIGKQLDTAVKRANADPFRYGFPWGDYDSTSHGFGLSVMASEYASLTGSAKYRTYATRWVDNVLGANAWGTSLVAGDGTTFPNCMQHQVTNIVGSLDGSPPVLAGAVVEGTNGETATGTVPGMRPCPPDGVDTFAPFNGHKAVYQDNVQSYPTVEPAIDLTATSPLAFAWLSLRR